MLLILRSVQAVRAECYNSEAGSCNQHTVSDLTWCRRLLATLCECAEDSHRNRSEGYNIEWVELLEDWSIYSNGLGSLDAHSAINEECQNAGTNQARKELTLSAIALEDRECCIYSYDDQYQVPYIEEHGAKTRYRGIVELVSEVCECKTILVECHPEEDYNGKYEDQCYDASLSLGRSEVILNLCSSSLVALATLNVTEPSTASVVDNHRHDQRCASHCKREVVSIVACEAEILLCPILDSHSSSRCEQCADVDSHVEQRECRVTLRRVLRVVVEITNHNLQVTLEEACTYCDEEQCTNHCNHSQGIATERQREEEVSEEHNRDTDGNHLTITKLIGQDTTEERHEIYKTEESTVNCTCYTCVQTEVGAEEQCKHSQHCVVAKTLTCVSESQGIKGFWMSFEHSF